MLCSKCKENPRRPNHRWCTVCHARYMREWRKTHAMNPEQKMKDVARSYAGVYLRAGRITKKPCEVCGSEKSEMHHPDYSKPLEIIWLCRAHHLELHRAEPHRKKNLHVKVPVV